MAAGGMDAGLDLAIEVLTEQKVKHPDISFADLIQMGNAVALRLTGGPPIPMRYGRLDGAQLTTAVQTQALTGGLLTSTGDACSAFLHLRQMGLSDAHSLTLAGDIKSGFKNRGPTLMSEDLPVNCDSQRVMYAKDGVALVRDWAWAQSRRSEIGAVFEPALGVQLN